MQQPEENKGMMAAIKRAMGLLPTRSVLFVEGMSSLVVYGGWFGHKFAQTRYASPKEAKQKVDRRVFELGVAQDKLKEEIKQAKVGIKAWDVKIREIQEYRAELVKGKIQREAGAITLGDAIGDAAGILKASFDVVTAIPKAVVDDLDNRQDFFDALEGYCDQVDNDLDNLNSVRIIDSKKVEAMDREIARWQENQADRVKALKRNEAKLAEQAQNLQEVRDKAIKRQKAIKAIETIATMASLEMVRQYAIKPLFRRLQRKASEFF